MENQLLDAKKNSALKAASLKRHLSRTLRARQSNGGTRFNDLQNEDDAQSGTDDRVSVDEDSDTELDRLAHEAATSHLLDNGSTWKMVVRHIKVMAVPNPHSNAMRISSTNINLDPNYRKPEKDEVLGLSRSRSFTSAVTWLDEGRPSNYQDAEEGEWLDNAHRISFTAPLRPPARTGATLDSQDLDPDDDDDDDDDEQHDFRYLQALALVRTRQYASAAQMLIAPADEGHAAASYLLGDMHMDGLGVDRDVYKAFSLYSAAADQDHEDGLLMASYCYIQGLGTNRSWELGLTLAARAASLHGNPSAQMVLGRSYEHGNGVGVDLMRALYYYCEAAEQGESEAMFCLAKFYERGKGNSTPDLSLALNWYKRAAKAGHPLAPAHCVSMSITVHRDQHGILNRIGASIGRTLNSGKQASSAGSKAGAGGSQPGETSHTRAD